MPTGSLPSEGKQLWEKVFEASKASGDDEEKAAKKAWGAVKNAGWHKKDGEWMKGKSEIAEMSMYISKASLDKKSQKMRWNMVTSDTQEDLYGERMSLQLYKDMVERIESESPIPSPFDSIFTEESWYGGMPYLSISHYKSAGGKNVPGEAEAVYIDGERLKAKGILYDTPLGNAVFKSLLKDLYGEEKSDSNKVRVSIGFIDLAHSHGDNVFTRTSLGQSCPWCSEGIGDKMYLKGQLVHLALTRVPVNPRTEMEVEKMEKAITKREDAESIVGELADELEDKSQAVVDESIVVKSDETPAAVTEESMPEKEPVKAEEPVVEAPAPVAEAPAPEKSTVDKAWDALRSEFESKKSAGVSGEEALKAVQPLFNDLGKAMKAELTTPLDVERANLSEIVKSTIEDTILPIIVALQTDLTEVKSKMALGVAKKEDEVTPRSLVVKRPYDEVPSPQSPFGPSPVKSKIMDIARRSVGLTE